MNMDELKISRHAFFWISFFVICGVILATLGEVLLPFIMGILVAYLFNPFIDVLSRFKLPRSLSAVIVIALIFVVVIGSWVVFLPLVAEQFMALLGKLPEYWEAVKESVMPQTWMEKTKEMIPENSVFNTTDNVQSFFEKHLSTVWTGVSGVMNKFWIGGRILFEFISFLLITPVVAFYMMRDWPNFVQKVDDMLPVKYSGSIKILLKQFDETLSGFIRGQALVCLLLGLFYAAALTIVGLNFGIVIGLVAGLLSFIPYVGSIVGLVSSVGVAIFQFQDVKMTAVVLGIFIVGQLLEGNYLTPKLVGKRVGLHAVWVLLALMVGGSLFGFVGVVVAVPVAAIMGVLVRFALALYRESEFYKGKKVEKNTKTKTTRTAKKAVQVAVDKE